MAELIARDLKWSCGMCGEHGTDRDSFDRHVNDHAAVMVAGVIDNGISVSVQCDPRTHQR